LLVTCVAFILTIKTAIQASSDDLSWLDKTFVFLANTGLIVIVVLLILAEFEPQWFVKLVYLLHFWVGRGLGQAWIGIQAINTTKQLAHAVGDQTGINTEVVSIVGQVCGWTNIGIGIIYMLLSILCLRGLEKKEGGELEVQLINTGETRSSEANGKGTVAVTVPTAANAGDAILLANMALALGISLDAARKRFGGKEGAKEAEKFVKQQALTAAQSKFSSPPSAPPMDTPTNNSNRNFTASPPPGGRSGTEPERGRNLEDEDDELARAYYGSRK